MGREWAFELGVVDASGRAGVVRCSTFQKSPALKRTTPPLLHLPLAFPTAASTPLTAWCTLAIHLPSLLPHFSSRSLLQSDDEEEEGGSSAQMPGAKYGHVSYVKIYATCRLRRVWFSETARNGSQKTPWEFLLYAADV
ncbi:hypothetical protein BV25DRAFT_1832454 [Artomyces pyxidatus]|uniref:Uncharacterized protein n=1 Tax=Artomyces pyxidatus TaxID=48021 RepID=A0ACB8SJ14_9AGAM|nr:hypothetical protein BV25DRAFT_1832454 [Artomyces pyxidatus]